MFGMNKKIKEMQGDPQKAMDYADKTLNKGFTGGITKAFMGKDFVSSMNETIAVGREGMNMQNSDQYGIPASAEVVSIQDSGQLINYDPIVILQLKVHPMAGPDFDMTASALVSKIAVPRPGDTIQIKYNPADMTKIAVL